MQLFVETRGEGPPMVWAHGFAGSGRNFRPQARAFQNGYKVVLFDARGHARSPSPQAGEAYEFECLVGDLLTLIEGQGGDRVVVGGLSMGARTALQVALRAPHRARALILASLPGPLATRAPWAVGFADAIASRGLEEAGARYVWGEDARLDERGRDWVRQGLLEHQPWALEHLLRRTMAKFPDLREISEPLSQLALPVLIVSGARDAEAVAQGNELQGLIRHAQHEVIQGAGHVVNLEASEAFNDVVRNFLGSCP